MLSRRHLMLAAAVAPLSMAAPARADDPASGFIDRMLRDMMAVVNGPGALPAKQAALARIIEANVDIDYVAKFCLGRFWRQASPAQQSEYNVLFHKMLITNISSKLGDYTGVSYTMGRAQPADGGMLINTTVTRPGAAPSKVDWLVSPALKLIDLIAEGTSLRLTQRSDYSSFLSSHSNDVQALLDAMRKQIK